jgi:MoaA/NifB/PqqE/SkfB family radical SAM enzyme
MFCELLKKIEVRITLLTTGLLLRKNADQIEKYIDEVIVSLDGSETVHNQIRNIPNGYDKLREGVQTLKELKPSLPVKARCVLQKENYHDFDSIVRSAKSIGVDQISFLAADITTDAFNRTEPWSLDKQSSIALDAKDCESFETILRDSFKKLQTEYESKFIAETPGKMLEIQKYYKALLGLGKFPERNCNAPWVSAVVESDGVVKPCFFHEAYGNMNNQNFTDIINSTKAIEFRKRLDIKKNNICEKCVCSLKIPWIKLL